MQGLTAHIDFETRSATDLVKSGVYRYAEDPTTWPWGFCYRIGNTGPWYEWRPGFPDPVALLAHVREGGTVGCHNAAFERTIWNWIIVGRICPHWPYMTIQQQDCTMSRAAAIAHPQGLGALGTALGTDLDKDMEGYKLMMKMAKPRRFNEDGSVTWWDDPADIDRNLLYCGRDVEVETQADEMLPALSPNERRVWEFDQLVNERGVPIDEHFVERAAQLVDYSKKQNDRVMREITDRAVPKCSNDKKLIAWLNSRGVECTSLAKGEVDDVIFLAQAAFDDTAYQAIKLRQAAWKTSTAKYRSKQKCVSSDGRIRGLLNYHGASTGRWAGRLTQPQNYPRNAAGPNENFDDDFLHEKVRWLHELLADETLKPKDVWELIVAVHGPLEPLELLSKALRSSIKAPEGRRFIGGDFSNIEGRVNAWLANEMWKLQAFTDYDNKVGPDLYKLGYARSFSVNVDDVTKANRQIGKVQELSLGYQGGVGAYLQMGANYGVNPFELSLPVQEATGAQQWDETAAKYHRKGTNRMGLFEREWTALQVLVDNWRKANPAIVQSWWNYQDAAIEAVTAPGTVVHPEHTRRVAYYSDGRALWCVLPSGRMLCYSAPEVVQEQREFTRADGTTYTTWKRKVTFWGIDSRTRQWTKQSLYGGLQCENIVQGTARDVMADAMFNVEDEGYPIILTVHDEILSEVDEGTHHNEHEFADIMSRMSPTYDGLPVSVGAWEDKRYVK